MEDKKKRMKETTNLLLLGSLNVTIILMLNYILFREISPFAVLGIFVGILFVKILSFIIFKNEMYKL